MSHKTVILHIWHSMSHAPSLLFPSHLSTTPLSTCTAVRLSISLLSTSHEEKPCEDPSNASFGPLAEPHSPTDRAQWKKLWTRGANKIGERRSALRWIRQMMAIKEAEERMPIVPEDIRKACKMLGNARSLGIGCRSPSDWQVLPCCVRPHQHP